MNENLNPDGENLSPAERDIEKVLRPQAFEDFTGQVLGGMTGRPIAIGRFFERFPRARLID